MFLITLSHLLKSDFVLFLPTSSSFREVTKMFSGIRPMETSDWPAVLQIYKEGLATGCATFQTECPSYAQWDVGHSKSCRFVSIIENPVVAWTALSPVSSRYAYQGVAEVSLYVGEKYRGRNLGTLLLEHLDEEATKAGYWTLQSVIFQDNKASVRIHEKCGFRLVGYRERIAQDSQGNWRNTVLMEKRSK